MYWMQKEKRTHKPVFKIKSFFFALILLLGLLLKLLSTGSLGEALLP